MFRSAQVGGRTAIAKHRAVLTDNEFLVAFYVIATTYCCIIFSSTVSARTRFDIVFLSFVKRIAPRSGIIGFHNPPNAS